MAKAKLFFLVEGFEAELIKHQCPGVLIPERLPGGNTWSFKKLGQVVAAAINIASLHDYYIVISDLDRRKAEEGVTHEEAVTLLREAILNALKTPQFSELKLLLVFLIAA